MAPPSSRVFCIPSIVFLSIAFILSLIVSISLPSLTTLDIARVRFDNATAPQVAISSGSQEQAQQLRFGIWSYCVYGANSTDRTCVDPGHGYSVQISYTAPDATSASNVTIGSSYTRGLGVHPVASAFTFLALLCSLSQHFTLMLMTIVLALLAAFLTFLAFIIDIALFVRIRTEMGHLGGAIEHTTAGPGFWLSLAALLLLLLSSCTVFVGRRRARARAGVQTEKTGGFWMRFRRGKY
ncbi:pali-domain-containing protein [Dentipellis sp. KUC8613]|nr:pali-domain-containing protein [Dentipellis sp. KUC8613]